VGIGVARGCTGCRCTPRAKKKNGVRGKFIGVSCKCTPRQSKKNFPAFFRCAVEIWSVRAVNLVVLACALRAATKKRQSTFSRKKVHH